jgi:hypothetical protein
MDHYYFVMTGLRHEVGLGASYGLAWSGRGNPVKGNQPGLLAALPWRDVPIACDQRERGHGRRECRTLKVTSVAPGPGSPHAAQAHQVVRRRKVKGKWSRETCYAVTSLTVIQAIPGQLAVIIRGHWGIEDRLHWSATLLR